MTALITGATRGIGRAIAEAFAAAGFHLAVSARSSAELEELQMAFARDFPHSPVHTFPADLGRKAEAQALGRKVLGRFSGLDVLVNNAGLYLEADISAEEDFILEQMMKVNLYGPYYLTKSLLPAMKAARSGHIFNICSVASREPQLDKGAYSVSKFALLGFTKALRLELAPHRVRVTAVLPGPTWSASWEGTEALQEQLMPPEDIALAVWNAWAMSPQTVVEEIVMRPLEE